MVNVTMSGIGLHYPGADSPSVEDLDLEIPDGEFLVLVGPSGCGKSTTLRMLAGLELPTSGTISFGGRNVTGADAKDRDVAMVFQSYALYPHMTVAGNMEFALKNAGMPKGERAAKVQEAAKVLELDALLDRKPRQLSGGQRQRVAMGRAIVRQPQVFLMDEPLSNLDAKLRVQTRAQISELQRRLEVTTVYVTHDQVEAMTMGDRVVVMNNGHIEQVGTPRELYDRPATLFVASFIGSPTINLLPARRTGQGAVAGAWETPLAPDLPAGGDGIVLSVRPEDLGTTPGDGATALELQVDMVEEVGSDSYVYGHVPGTPALGEKPVVARVPKGENPVRGDRLSFYIRPGDVRVFDEGSGELVG